MVVSNPDLKQPFAQWDEVTVTFGAADTDVGVQHTLHPDNPEHIDYFVVRKGQAMDVYNDTSGTRKAWTAGVIYLRSTVAGATASILLRVRHTAPAAGFTAPATIPVATTPWQVFSTSGTTNDVTVVLATTLTISYQGGADATINGMSGGVAGRRLRWVNQSSFVCYFAHNSASGTAGHKFINTATTAATPVAPGGWIEYDYDGANSRWQIVAYEQGAIINWAPADVSGAGLTFSGVDSYYTLRGKQLFLNMRLVYPVNANALPSMINGFPFTVLNEYQVGTPLYQSNPQVIGYPVWQGGSSVIRFMRPDTQALITNAQISNNLIEAQMVLEIG